MAKLRSIKVEFWTSPQIVECKPLTRLFFIGLWNFCDDGGIHPYSIKRLKMEIFPADEEILSTGIEQMLNELETNDLIEFYTVSDEKFIKVTGWEHQKTYEKFYKFPNQDGIIPPNETYSRSQRRQPRKQKKQTVTSEVTDSQQSVNNELPDSQQTVTSEVTDSQQTCHEHGMECNEMECNEMECNEIGMGKSKTSLPPPLFNFKTKTKIIPITQEYVDELVNSFKNLDVFYSLGKMNQWLNDNPTKRPYAKNIKARIRQWMAEDQEAMADVC